MASHLERCLFPGKVTGGGGGGGGGGEWGGKKNFE